MRHVAMLALISALLGAAAEEARGDVPAGAPGDSAAERLRLYDRGVALVEQHRHGEAVPLFEQVLAQTPEWTEARINLGIALLNQQKDLSRTEAELKKALEAQPQNPWAHYTLAMLYKHLGQNEQAQEHLEAVLRADPKSADAHAMLGTLLAGAGKLAEAESHFRAALELDPYLVPAHYGLGRALLQQGKAEEGRKQLEEFQALRKGHAGKDRSLVYTEMGRYAEVIRRTPGPVERPLEPAASWAGPAAIPGAPAQAVTGVTIANVLGDEAPELLVAYGPAAPLHLCRRGEDGLSCAEAGAGTALEARSADLDHDGRRDLLLRTAEGVRVWWQKAEGRFEAGPELYAGRTVGAELGDLDADGDLDVVLAGPDGAAVRWNARDGRFTAEPVAEARAVPEVRGLLLADLDEDGDLDALLLTAHGALAWKNGRLGRMAAPELAAPDAAPQALWLDRDADGRQELVIGQGLAALDVGLDGSLDLIEAAKLPGLADATCLARGDLDGDGDEDLAAGTPRGPLLVQAQTPPGRRWIAIALASEGDQPELRGNPSGLGAFVELKAADLWRRFQVTSGPSDEAIVLGLGPRSGVDYVHVEWSDGVVQSELDLAVDRRHRIPQVQRKLSSCPILFAWDGTQFAFVTDFLGGGGLGFWIGPEAYGPPDPVERVRIGPEQLRERDGGYVLKIAEPMEEITYLDRAELLVVDHPAGTEVHPDERFVTGAPARRDVLWLVQGAVLPRRAADGAGADQTSAVSAADRVYAAPARPDPRFLGYADPAVLRLDFGDAAAAWSQGAVLLLDGWVEYPYSRVNYAAHQAGRRMLPASLGVVEPDGSVKPVYAEFGYPAGMPRTLALPLPPELTLGRSPLVLQLDWAMEIYWDRARIAPARTVPASWIRRLAPESAELDHAGYMREFSPDGRLPRLYDRQSVERSVAMRDLYGAYTRFGEVTPLLGRTDDAFVIFGRGEELTLRFRAPAPPPAGQVRTCLLEADGYCKDRDAHTAFAETVEPLPFHAMPGYPYPGRLRPPDSELARRFNTRRIVP
jgi:tetratricopeptide (TPR) repeat protein